MYYESIKVLDCTIRDGGLVNKHDFSLEFVRRLYTLLSAAGVDYMEMGYKNSPELFDPKEYGPWKFCEDDLLWKVKDGIESNIKMAVMADVGRVNMDAVKPASESPYQMFRVASYVKNIDKGIEMVNAFHDMGYETTLNIMAVSRDRGPELDEALHQVNEECKADVLYLVDSFGAFYQEDIDKELTRYKGIVKNKKFGFHGHNNQQLAFSNTIQALFMHDCFLSQGS
jgi:4-hydroxy 2-oxovalerate aldolase